MATVGIVLLSAAVTGASSSTAGSSGRSISIVGNHEMSDWQKLTSALGGLSFTSVDELLQKIGLAKMPKAHLYGMAGGVVTFVLTLSIVGILLLKGGTFQRLFEQLQSSQQPKQKKNNAALMARKGRPLLFEQLLETRTRLKTKNYPSKYTNDSKSTDVTALAKMLLSVVPPANFTKNSLPTEKLVGNTNAGFLSFVSKIITDKSTPSSSDIINTTIATVAEGAEQTYQVNYALAYRRCQDKPGGDPIPGYPDARMEAYARSYAGCPPLTTTAYRRSYARVYEAISCVSQKTMEHFEKLYQTYPQDIVGRTVRLQSLDPKRHADGIFHALEGTFDDESIWCFLDYGPFRNTNEMVASDLFRRREGEAAFAVYHQVTEKVIGCVLLCKDDPKNLSIQLEACIAANTQELSSSSSSSDKEELEACFLILDRLFAFGYRRIQATCDVADAKNNKFLTRLGFILEGTLPKHRIIKDANSDSNMFALTNNEWQKKGGVRAGLFKKLHGAKALTADQRNESRESELEMWEKHLGKQKA